MTLRQFQHHPRDWRNNLYVYPVISRRSSGLSIGINLNPDTACNFDCIYCQVDRSGVPKVREVDPSRLADELRSIIGLAQSGELFADADFADVPEPMRAIRDIAFSGDGEPTTCPHFRKCVETIAAIKREAELNDLKIVLITDACYLTRPEVVAGLAIMDQNNGEIWAKLDAGTEKYYKKVNRPNYPLRHVMDNIIAAARVRPIVIQSLFMRIDGAGPNHDEIDAYLNRLRETIAAGGKISLVQVYTVARRPADSSVTPLTDGEVDEIAGQVREKVGLEAKAFYGTPTL
ncbi:MAG: radical SAM protein [Planctomycetes bacterium]|nr:radical SAM protein [Planctomycetota bacterium]MBI3835364.1 radical SAM protein [Planctomycetota bacterium]